MIGAPDESNGRFLMLGHLYLCFGQLITNLQEKVSGWPVKLKEHVRSSVSHPTMLVLTVELGRETM